MIGGGENDEWERGGWIPELRMFLRSGMSGALERVFFERGIQWGIVRVLMRGLKGGMHFALQELPCMIRVLCNFDILNTTFTFLTKLNHGPRCGE